MSPLPGRQKNAVADESERRKEKTEERVKEKKIVKAGVCLESSDASVHHAPDSSLMEYPGRRRAEGGRRGRRGRGKSRGEKRKTREEYKD